MKMYIDFETRSPVDLRACGVYVYAEHPQTSILMMAWALDNGPIQVWTPGSAFPHQFLSRDDVTLIAHNAQFERVMWKAKLDWPVPPLERWSDTAARAAMCGLPRTLDGAAKALGLNVQKDEEGYRLMLQMCKPRRLNKRQRIEQGVDEMEMAEAFHKMGTNHNPTDPRLFQWRDDPQSMARLAEYCAKDVEVERALDKLLPDLPPMEKKIWMLDQRINDRGVAVDVTGAIDALCMIEAHTKSLTQELETLTNGAVTSAKQSAALAKHLGMDNVQKGTVKESLTTEEDPVKRRILEIRQSLGMSSTAKYEALLNATCRDNRMRGLFMYHGASTGRFTGKLFQPQNLPRGDSDRYPEPEYIIDSMSLRDPQIIELIFGDPMEAASNCLRGMLVAPEGKMLVAADFASIEGRGLAWVAGEEHVLQGYREGLDPYKVDASAIYKIGYKEITKKQRQVGKTANLACFGPCTQVLTSNGVKSIAEITTSDLLWDGVEWVQHDGVVEKGVKEVIDVCGVEVTPDHLIRTKQTWTPARQLVSNANTLSLALETGLESLQCLGSYESDAVLAWWTSSKCAALAEPSPTSSMKPISEKGGRLAVMSAPSGPAAPTGRSTSDTLTFAPMTNTGGVCLTDSRPARAAATIPVTKTTPTMAAGASSSITLGEPISGLSSSMWSRLRGGTSLVWTWIASMWTGDTSPATYALSPAAKTPSISDRSNRCRSVSKSLKPVFDILNSGSRNRFLILSDHGPLLVHNCGYMGGVAAMKRFGAGKMGLSDDELQEIVTKWRAGRPATVALWRGLDEAAMAAMRTGNTAKFKRIRFGRKDGFLCMQLPNGRLLRYYDPKLEIVETPWGGKREAVTVMNVNGMTKQWERRPMHGGLWTENCFTADALVVTARGVLPIVEVLPGDRVWDGAAWVTTDGPVERGEKEVVEWLGIHVTPDHLITDGQSWKAVMDLDEQFEEEALAWARSSVLSPSFYRGLATTVRHFAAVFAGAKSVKTPAISTGKATELANSAGGSTEGKHARKNGGTEISLQIQNYCLCGGIGTQEWSPGASTQRTKPTKITVAEESACSSVGLTTEETSSVTPLPCLGGIDSGWTSTASTTTGITAPAMCGLSNEKLTQETNAQTYFSRLEEGKLPSRSSGKSSAKNGAASIVCTTTSAEEKPWKKLPKYAEGKTPVFDLLNCGPDNRFTVLTKSGPVVVHNCIQALCRDLLAEAMLRLDERGYDIVLHVHDEIVAERANPCPVELEVFMSEAPTWAEGFPIRAEGFKAKRYRK